MRGCAAIAVKLQNTGVKAIELSSVFIRQKYVLHFDDMTLVKLYFCFDPRNQHGQHMVQTYRK